MLKRVLNCVILSLILSGVIRLYFLPQPITQYSVLLRHSGVHCYLSNLDPGAVQ